MTPKRFLIGLLVAMMLVPMFAVATSAEAGDKQMVRWLYPGSEGKNHAAITDYVNGLLDRDNMNIQFQAIPIAWDVWDQKINLMFSVGEEFEFVHVPEGFGPGYVELWNRQASIRVNELLDEYAPTIKSVIPDWLWEAATIDGNITTIPAFWVETAGLKGGVTVRSDLYDAYGLALPTTLDELLTTSKTLQEKMLEDGLYERKAVANIRYQEIQTYMHRTYETYPFTVIDQLLLVRQDGKVESWIDSPEFAMDCDFYNKLYLGGMMEPDILSLSMDDLEMSWRIGNTLFSEWNCLNGEPGLRIASGNDNLRLEYVVFNPDKGILRDQGVRNSNIVSSTSPNPEAAVRFHEWMYANEDAYWAMEFGVEGLTYTREGDIYEMIPDEPTLGLADWMIANINLQPYIKNINQKWVETTMKEEMNAVNSITIGFAFDPAPVEIEYANCLSELKNVVYPLRAGVMSYADGYAIATEALKAAGIDALVAEYQRQLDEWRG